MDKNASSTQAACVNCGEMGHPASYRGCRYLKVAQDIITSKRTQVKVNTFQKVNKISKRVTTGLSFSQATQNATSLQRTEQIPMQQAATMITNNHNLPPPSASHRYAKQNDTHLHQPSMDHISNIDLQSIQFTLKNEIVSAISAQILDVKGQIHKNASKIDHLYKSLNVQWP